MKKLLLFSSCLLLSLASTTTRGAIQYWDPQGTTGANPYTGNMSGTWETPSWSASSAGVASPTTWVDSAVSGSSVAAVFAVHAGTGTPAFTVTLNSNHTVAGFFANGIVTGLFSTTTLQGPGVITIGPTSTAQPYTTLFANLQGVLASSGTVLTIYNNIAGTLANSGGLTAESSGQVALFGTNTYSCGTLLGFSGSGFYGVIYYTNADPTQGAICTSFGTAAIGISNCQGGALVAPTTEPITVTNAVNVYNWPTGQALNLVGSTFGATFSGPWSLGTNVMILGAGPTGFATIISGVISGSGGITRGQGNLGTLQLNATNTFTGALTVSNGTVALGPNGSVSNAGNIFISPGATFDVSAVPSPYSLSSSTTLNASGTGTSVGSAAAAINGSAAGVVNLGAQPINLTLDSTGNDPGLYISQGALTLNGNLITINPAFALNAGTYPLIQVASGTINGAPSSNVVVTGLGLADGCMGWTQVTNGNVNLVVVQGHPETWNGGDFGNSPNWSDNANWIGGSAPDLIGDALTFSGTTGPTPVMDNAYTAYSVTFDGTAGQFTLTNSGGNVLTVSDGVTNSSGVLQTFSLPVEMVDFGQPGPTVWDVTSGPIAVTGVLSDTGRGLVVTGGNTLTLSNANTYTGGTVISNNATLIANTISDANCSIGPSGAVVIGTGGTFTYTGTNAVATSRGFSFSGAGTDSLNLPNGATLTLNGAVKSVSTGIGTLAGNGTLILGGTTDNGGLGMTVNSGTKLILDKSPSASNAHALGGSLTTINSGGIMQVAGPGSFQLYSGCTVNEMSGGLVDFDGQSDSFSTYTLSGTGINNSGALINSAAGTTSFLTNGNGTGGIVLAGDTTIGASSGSPGNITLVGKMSGPHVLTYAGTGLLTLSGSNYFTGGLNINSGCSVMLTSGGYTNGGGGVGPVTINGNGTLILTNIGGLANTSVTGGSGSTMFIEMGGGNLWLTNSLASFVGTYIVTNPANASSAQLVVGSTAAVTPNINASATWNIYPGVTIDFNVGQTDPAPVNLYGLTYSSAPYGTLRLDSSLQSGPVILHGSSSIGGNGATSNSIISGVISDGGSGYGLTMAGICRVSLTATNTYSGPTAINGGTLALSGTGAISNSSKISIGAGGTFDVSALASSTFALSASTTLSASGKGTAVGSTAAALNGASGGIINLGAQPISLTFTPTTFTGDATHPCLYIPQGALTLGGNTISVSNAAASPLGVGAYTLIQVAGGTISGAPTAAVTVSGAGLVPGDSASVSVSGGNVIMTVVAAPTKPVFTGVKVSGTTLTIMATNGTASGNYVLLESTNVALPLTNWTPVLTNMFDTNGNVNLSTNVINTNVPVEFFIIQNP